MIERERVYEYRSVFAPFIRDYAELRRSLGYKFMIEAGVLRQFDHYCLSIGLERISLNGELIENWIATKGNDKSSTRSHRISTLKGFGEYLEGIGLSVSWHPAPGYGVKVRDTRYVPYIFTKDEMRKIFENADRLPKPRGSAFHIVFPAVLRILYGCGLRVSEVLALRVRDVDMEGGFLTVNGTKFDKSRRLPISDSLTIALRAYTTSNGIGMDRDAFFFPNPKGEMYSQRTVYDKFRAILWRSGIPHQGLGKGPRVHDLRHTFAVHSLRKNLQEGMDSYVSLPILSAYLGHSGVRSTEYYLRLTAEVYPEFLIQANTISNTVIPEVTGYEA